MPPSFHATVPIRAVTHGPKFHWFGYYDKLQFDPSGRFLLAMETDFENRSPKPDDTIRVGVVDSEDGDRWTDLGETRAWCWQQGCMLQWLPGSDTEVIWNDREGDQFVSRILDIRTSEARTVPAPVYALFPDGRHAVAPDFGRVQDMRPGYGYAGVPDPHRGVGAPDDSGIFLVDLETGASDLIVALAEVAALPFPHADLSRAKHWFNHLLVSPDGGRVEFLHRWQQPGEATWLTRMLTCAPDGSDLRIVNSTGLVSHFIWRDARHLLAFAGRDGDEGWRYYVMDETTGEATLAMDSDRDGHCSYLPGAEWILNDSYIGGPDRMQALYLYRVATGEKVELGAFHLPPGYDGEWRCDLHPRISPDGRFVTIDSAHGGDGRQVYLLDIGAIVE
jgi:hypothetical protein